MFTLFITANGAANEQKLNHNKNNYGRTKVMRTCKLSPRKVLIFVAAVRRQLSSARWEGTHVHPYVVVSCTAVIMAS